MPNMQGQPMGYRGPLAGQAAGRMPEVAYSWGFLASAGLARSWPQRLPQEALRASEGHASQPPGPALVAKPLPRLPDQTLNPVPHRDSTVAAGRPSGGPVSEAPAAPLLAPADAKHSAARALAPRLPARRAPLRRPHRRHRQPRRMRYFRTRWIPNIQRILPARRAERPASTNTGRTRPTMAMAA